MSYTNANKTKAFKRSKLEYWLEKQLSIIFPELKILYNDSSEIGSELDIYIPSLRLAFELNGIFHYEPIHGQEYLEKVQKRDCNKFEKCHNSKISLCVIDTSSQKSFSEKGSKRFLDIIVKIINKTKK